jgi:hypothetical protein
MQRVVSEENHNTVSQYSRSVGRDRNIGPATIKQYQLTVANVKSHSKSCSASTLLLRVNNYERIFALYSSYS